jgi:hypothetical protein
MGESDDYFLSRFSFDYTAGNAFGMVQAELDSGEAHPDDAGVKTYELSVEIEEWVP